MHLARKMGVTCITLCILFAQATEVAAMAALAQPQMVVKEKVPQTADVNMAAGVTDSTGNYEYIILQDGTAQILKYLKEEEEVIVPPQLDGYPVTVIGEEAFDYKLSTVNIQIPGTVTEIKRRAFSRTGIKEISIPESVLKVGEEAFWYCQNLEKVYIPQNVKQIEGNIVQWSNKLTRIDVDIHNTAYTSVDGVLYNKDVTELLAVPGGKNMTGFQFPDSVVCIGEHAFSQCANESFSKITIPDQVTVLGRGAFSYCRSLEKVVIGKGVEEITGSLFFGCERLSKVIINGNPKAIGKEAFLGCYSLAEINIPDSVVKIGENAFEDCHSLKNIMLPKSVTQIGDKAFGYHEDGKYEDVSIVGYRYTIADYYAKANQINFRDIENGKVISYDVSSVPGEKIQKLTAGKKKIKLSCKKIEGAEYEIAVKMVGYYTWEKYVVFQPTTVIKGLKSGKQYKVKVRALRTVGATGYGKWSKVKKVTVR